MTIYERMYKWRRFAAVLLALVAILVPMQQVYASATAVVVIGVAAVVAVTSILVALGVVKGGDTMAFNEMVDGVIARLAEMGAMPPSRLIMMYAAAGAAYATAEFVEQVKQAAIDMGVFSAAAEGAVKAYKTANYSLPVVSSSVTGGISLQGQQLFDYLDSRGLIVRMQDFNINGSPLHYFGNVVYGYDSATGHMGYYWDDVRSDHLVYGSGNAFKYSTIFFDPSWPGKLCVASFNNPVSFRLSFLDLASGEIVDTGLSGSFWVTGDIKLPCMDTFIEADFDKYAIDISGVLDEQKYNYHLVDHPFYQGLYFYHFLFLGDSNQYECGFSFQRPSGGAFYSPVSALGVGGAGVIPDWYRTGKLMFYITSDGQSVCTVAALDTAYFNKAFKVSTYPVKSYYPFLLDGQVVDEQLNPGWSLTDQVPAADNNIATDYPTWTDAGVVINTAEGVIAGSYADGVAGTVEGTLGIPVSIPDDPAAVGSQTQTGAQQGTISDSTVEAGKEAISEADAEQTVKDLQLPADITGYFPFCIPFDIIRGIQMLQAPAVTPKFEIPISAPEYGLDYTFVLDFGAWDTVGTIIAVLRWGQAFIFVVALAATTKNHIWG